MSDNTATGLIWIAIAGYLLPTLIALLRGHRSFGGIAVLNILLGWTIIGYFGSLIWSLADSGRRSGKQRA